MSPETHKNLYEAVVNTEQTQESLGKALETLLKLALANCSHFDFLLHHINWFD